MTIRLLFSVFLSLLAISLPAQTKKGFKSLKKKDFTKAIQAFAQDTANLETSPTAFFGLAKTYETFAKKSLDSAILAANFAVKSKTLLVKANEDALKIAQKHHVSVSACTTLISRLATTVWPVVEKSKSIQGHCNFKKAFPDFYKKGRDRVESSAWAAVEKAQTFQSLEKFREYFPEFLNRNAQDKKVSELRRKIARNTYEKTNNYHTLNLLVKHHRDYLYRDDISMDSDMDIKLWKAFSSDVGIENLEKFIEDQPNHWMSSDCWSGKAVTALKEKTPASLIAFVYENPNSYLAYWPFSWYIDSEYGYGSSTNALDAVSRKRLEEIKATRRLDDHLSISREAPTDTAAFFDLIRSGAPSWRSYFLMERAFENCLRAKQWDLAARILSVAAPLFPNVEPDRCKSLYYRRQEWFVAMSAVLNVPYEPLNPRPIIELNTMGNEVLPFVSPDGKTLYFTGDGRPDGLQREDPYEVSFSDSIIGKPQLVKGIAGEKNESILSITADGQEALVFVDGSLHMSKMTPRGWSKPEELPDIQSKYPWIGKASLTADGSAMVFEAMTARPQPGQNPNMDIYVALRDAKGGWKEPFPLPANINTRFKERSPYIHVDGKSLYFSSNGHFGLGGMDIFKTSRLDSTWQNWEDPVNMGREINTVEDDWGFIFSVTADGKTAFFSQKDDNNGRKGELMTTGLPKRVRPKKVVIMEIPVKSSTVQSLEVKNRNGVVIKTVPISPTSRKATVVVEESEGTVSIEAKGTDVIARPIEVKLTQIAANSKIDTLVAVTIKELIATPSVFQIPDVHFDRSDSTLLVDAKLALNRFYKVIQGKKLRFSITGHTDNVGTEEKNKELSESRAKVVKDYLVGLGYPEDLIATFGKGWSEPKVPNNSEKNKAINRRVEFQFIN